METISSAQSLMENQPTPSASQSMPEKMLSPHEKRPAKLAKVGYHPDRSHISPDVLRDFLNSLLVEDLECIPGIGRANKLHLLSDQGKPGLEPISTTYELLGKFLSLKGPGMSCVEHCDRFYFWLHGKGVTHNANTIVRAVAERVNIMIPGMYDEGMFQQAA